GAGGARVALAAVELGLAGAAAGVERSVENACASLASALGAPHVLAALAGLRATRERWQAPLGSIPARDLLEAFAVDTVGTFLFAQALAPALAASRGSIVLMSSAAALYGDTLGLAFAPAKSANAGLVKLLAR